MISKRPLQYYTYQNENSTYDEADRDLFGTFRSTIDIAIKPGMLTIDTFCEAIVNKLHSFLFLIFDRIKRKST